MSELDPYAPYADALRALSSAEDRRRAALRKAVEAAGDAAVKAETRMADQQRVYDRANRDATAAEGHLAEVSSILGPPPSPTTSPVRPSETTRSLDEIRGQIAEVSQWAVGTKPVVESLMRTRARREPSAPAPASRERQPPRGRLIAAIAAAAAFILVLIVVVLVSR